MHRYEYKWKKEKCSILKHIHSYKGFTLHVLISQVTFQTVIVNGYQLPLCVERDRKALRQRNVQSRGSTDSSLRILTMWTFQILLRPRFSSAACRWGSLFYLCRRLPIRRVVSSSTRNENVLDSNPPKNSLLCSRRRTHHLRLTSKISLFHQSFDI